MSQQIRELSALELLPLRPRDYLVLLALAGGPMHGYGLIQEIETLSEGKVRMDPANLHRAIQRFLRDGWVLDRGRQEVSQGRRRVFELSELGLRVARAEAGRLDGLAAVARARLLQPGSEGVQ